jgi:hypothetical protein
LEKEIRGFGGDMGMKALRMAGESSTGGLFSDSRSFSDDSPPHKKVPPG